MDKLEFMRELEYSGYYLEDISERQSKLNGLNIYEACIVNDEYTMAIYEDENKGILDSLRSAVSSVLKLITHAIGLVIKTAKNIIDFGKYKHLEQKFSKNKNYKTKKVKIKNFAKIEELFKKAIAKAERLPEDATEEDYEGIFSELSKSIDNTFIDVKDDTKDSLKTALSVVTCETAISIAKSNSKYAKAMENILVNNKNVLDGIYKSTNDKYGKGVENKIKFYTKKTKFAKFLTKVGILKNKSLIDTIDDTIKQVGKALEIGGDLAVADSKFDKGKVIAKHMTTKDGRKVIGKAASTYMKTKEVLKDKDVNLSKDSLERNIKNKFSKNTKKLQKNLAQGKW